MHPDELLKRAAEAGKHAHAPYSNFRVGAALLAENGQTFTGCNVENASYGLTVCAERTAVFKAVSEGVKTFAAIAIAVPGGGSPCGACRQVLHEFNPRAIVYLGDETGRLLRETTVAELLPAAFGSENLG